MAKTTAPTTPTHPTIPHIHTLTDAGLTQSAVILAQLTYYAYTSVQTVPSGVLYTLAHAYQADKQYKRALRLSQQLHDNPAYTHWLHEQTHSTHVPVRPVQPVNNRLNVLVNVLESYLALNEHKYAIKAWTDIIDCADSQPSLYTTIPADTLSRVGRISSVYGNTVQKQCAVKAYTLIVQQHPYAIHECLRMIELGVDANAILQAAGSRFDANSEIGQVVHKLMIAHQYTVQYKHQHAIDAYVELNAFQQSRNPYLLCQLAHAHTQISDLSVGQYYYNLAVQADAYQLDGMSWYALLLYKRGHKAQLNKLVQTLLSVSESSVDTWTSCALLYAIDNTTKAQLYVKKALSLNSIHIPALLAHSIISILTVTADQPDSGIMSIQACRQAQLLAPWEMSIYMLLANGYIDSSNEVRMSWHICQKALELNKKNSKFLTLAASVLLHTSMLNTQMNTQMNNNDNIDKSEKLLMRALQFDAGHLDAKLALVDLYMYRKQFTEAVTLLTELLQPRKPAEPTTDSAINTALQQYEVVHNKLGQVYAQIGKLDLALQHIHSALRIQPEYQPAVLALQAIENELKGGTDEVHRSADADMA